MDVETSTYYVFIDGTGQIKSDLKKIELNDELKHLKRKEKSKRKSLYLRSEEFLNKFNKKVDYFIKNQLIIKNKKSFFEPEQLNMETTYVDKNQLFKTYINNYSKLNKKQLFPYKTLLTEFEKEEELEKKKKEEKEFYNSQRRIKSDNIDLRNKLRYYDFSKQLSREQLTNKGSHLIDLLPIKTEEVLKEKNDFGWHYRNSHRAYLCSNITIDEKIKYSKYADRKRQIFAELNKHYK